MSRASGARPLPPDGAPRSPARFASATLSVDVKELSALLARLQDPAALPAVLATLVRVQGSSYRRVGARLLMAADGHRLGSISGGCLEEDVIVRAQRVLASGRPETVVYDTNDEHDLVWGVGLGCSGVVHVLLERVEAPPAWALRAAAARAQGVSTPVVAIYESADASLLGTYLAADAPACPPGTQLHRENLEPPPALAVFGAGDDAQPLVRMAKELGWRISVADSRPAYVSAERFPAADQRVVCAPEAIAHHVSLDTRTAAVVMTHRYRQDLPLLRELLPRPLAYLGLLGSRARAEKLLQEAGEALALPAAQLARVHAPIGLDLGGEAPEAIALAILAEIQATLAGRSARPLRERDRPIHAD